MSKFIPPSSPWPPLPPGGVPSPPQRHYVPGKSDGALIAWSVFCALLSLVALSAGDAGLILFLLVVAIWIPVAWSLLIVYLIARAGRRRCPVCGTQLPTGPTRCQACGHDFAAR